MEFGPIWRALMRNKSSYILIALQIAVTMAIMVNAVAIIQERSQLMARPSGVDEDNIFYMSSDVFAPDVDMKSLVIEDLDAIRSTPGVRDAVATNSVPLRGGGSSMGLQTEPGVEIDATGAAVYFIDEHGLETFGVNLIAGRNFNAEEIAWNDPESSLWPPYGIITKAVAKSLFPDEEPADVVGKTIYVNADNPVEVLGIVDVMQAAWSGWDGVERTMLAPLKRESSPRYVIRTEPGMRDKLMPQIEEMLAARSKDRIIQRVRTMSETRIRSYQDDDAMVKMLTFIVTLLTVITGLGIVGLASFSVSRRTKQIGTRRALGATRSDILRYFMVENFVVSGIGIIFGAMLAVGMNIWMVNAFDLSRMAWYIVPVAMITLWVVGQTAVAGPARRASCVSPAVATRAV
jgi:putative ABC transport system permease protein